jgi:hypothetical protein
MENQVLLDIHMIHMLVHLLILTIMKPNHIMFLGTKNNGCNI